MAHQSAVWGSLEAGGTHAAPSQKRWLWALPIVTLALFGATAVWRYSPARAASLRADFALQLQRAGSDYRVAWDTHSPLIRAADRGTLFIKDGSFETALAMDRDELAGTGLVYSPATNDVSFRLELYRSGSEPAIASVRLLAGSRPEVATQLPSAEVPTAAVETAPPPVTEAAPAVATEPPPAAPAEQVVDQPAASDGPTTMAAAPKPEIPQDPPR
jgi:hypothetical protein